MSEVPLYGRLQGHSLVGYPNQLVADAHPIGGLVFKAHRLCVSLNSRLESKKEEDGHTPEACEP